MENLLHAIKECKLFRDLPDDVIAQNVLPYGQILDYPRHSHLVMAQDSIDTFGLILMGKVNIQYVDDNDSYRIMDILEPGDLFGVDLMCTRSRVAPYHAVTAQITRMLVFPMSMILNPDGPLADHHVPLLMRLLQMIGDENIRKEYRLAILCQRGMRDRIMTFLTMRADRAGSNTFSVPFSRSEMASYMCVNRTSLSHELSLMEQEGILRFDKNRFTLLKRDIYSSDEAGGTRCTSY